MNIEGKFTIIRVEILVASKRKLRRENTGFGHGKKSFQAEVS